MSHPFNEFLHGANADSIPDEMLGLGRKWLLDLLGVARSFVVYASRTSNR